VQAGGLRRGVGARCGPIEPTAAST
jgi:hypothetical protein